jgi:hypothetical protein
MRKVLLCTTALLLAAGLVFADALDKKIEAETQEPLQAARALDCTGALPLACGDVVTGDNTGLVDNNATYSCVSWNESGGETVYEFTIAGDEIVTFTLSNMTADFDLFLLGSCDPLDCIDYADNSVTTECLTAGTYYVVVDGYNGATGSYQLDVACESCEPPPPIENDVCETAIDLCLVSGEKTFDGSFSLAYTTIGAADDYSPGVYPSSCTGFGASGGDVVYVVCLEPGGTLDVTQTGDFDMAMYLITDCTDPAGTCVVGSDNCCTGADEFFTYTSVAGGTYYLIVDGYSTEGTGTVYGTVTGCCTTSTEEGSWGGVKTLFR